MRSSIGPRSEDLRRLTSQRFVDALSEERVAELQIESWQEYALRERAQVRVLSTQDDGARPGDLHEE